MAVLDSTRVQQQDQSHKSAFLHRHLHHDFPSLARAEGHYLVMDDGRQVFDASGGAAVACVGHSNPVVNAAMIEQISKGSYCATGFFTTPVVEEAAQALVDSTGGQMARAYIVNSGSEAMEAAMKLARQFFLEKDGPEPQRSRFIARNQSYHGTTLGALSMGGHVFRRANFEPMLMENVSRVSPCFAYRGKTMGETDENYVQRLADELDDEFQRVGPESVCAFVAEPVVGAALGCVPAVAGYFQAMHSVCKKYGALLILDEVMSGMGRCGTYHAWQAEGVVPDLQTVGKGLGGGYQPVAGVLVHRNIADALAKGTGAFVHGHTYQGHAVGCAAIVAVQRLIQEKGLIEQARVMGALLGKLLHTSLGSHPNVGDIRGRGLFWGIELVQDRATKSPFPPGDNVAVQLNELGLTAPYSMLVYPGSGTVDGASGDHIIIAPAYTVTVEDIEYIVRTVSRLIQDFFSSF